MKIKKWILKLLLSAFVFIVVHDFVMNQVDPETQVELTLYKMEHIPLCDASSLHELLHASMIAIPCRCDAKGYHDSYKTHLYTEPKKPIFSTHLNSLFRPPIV